MNDLNIPFTATDKRVDLNALVDHVGHGDCLAVGGGLSSRVPMAAVCRPAARRARPQSGWVSARHRHRFVCGGGAVAASAESYVGFEQDFGMAPNYRRACEAGEVKVEDSCCYTVVQQLRAAISGLPFMPVRSVRGTDIVRLNPDYRLMTCPFTGKN